MKVGTTKRRRAKIGEERVWSDGKTHVKTAQGWKPPGALHHQLGIKGKIPVGELVAAAKKKTKGGDDTKLAKRARLALTLRSFKRGK